MLTLRQQREQAAQAVQKLLREFVLPIIPEQQLTHPTSRPASDYQHFTTLIDECYTHYAYIADTQIQAFEYNYEHYWCIGSSNIPLTTLYNKYLQRRDATRLFHVQKIAQTLLDIDNAQYFHLTNTFPKDKVRALALRIEEMSDRILTKLFLTHQPQLFYAHLTLYNDDKNTPPINTAPPTTFMDWKDNTLEGVSRLLHVAATKLTRTHNPCPPSFPPFYLNYIINKLSPPRIVNSHDLDSLPKPKQFAYTYQGVTKPYSFTTQNPENIQPCSYDGSTHPEPNFYWEEPYPGYLDTMPYWVQG